MGSRSETLARGALDRLYKEGGIKPGLVKYYKVDLATPKSVKAATDAFLRNGDGRLDILGQSYTACREHGDDACLTFKTVCNAGV